MLLRRNMKNLTLKGSHVSIREFQVQCIFLHHLPPAKRCAFVKKSLCDEESHFVKYHHLFFCGLHYPSFDNPFFIASILGVLCCLVLLFLILAVTVDEYFCPALGIISKKLHLSENLSGVTLLALGNGLPDILSAISSSAKGDTILMYNQILGGGMFVSCVVAGSIAATRPFYLHPYHFIRDSFFTLTAITWIEATTHDELVSIWEASSYIAIYALYLIVVIGGYIIQERLQDFVIIDKKGDVDWSELRKRSLSLGDSDDISLDISIKTLPDVHTEDEETKETVRTLLADFWTSLNPFAEWREKSLGSKIFLIITSPILMILNLIIPVVSAATKRNGWCKLLNCFHTLIYPTIFTYIIRMHYLKFHGIPIFVCVIPFGVLLATIVFFTSKETIQPRYHIVFVFMSFSNCIFVIYHTVQEVVAVLNLFGTLLQITPQTLGLTVLALGNSLGDAIANIQIAKQGFQRMAFAACFAGILANTCLSMGTSFLIRNLSSDTHETEARGGVMGPNCSTFFIMNLSFQIIYIFLTKFQARKSFGIFLILMYVEFFMFCVLCELEFIHPLGTDHEFAKDLFEGLNVTIT